MSSKDQKIAQLERKLARAERTRKYLLTENARQRETINRQSNSLYNYQQVWTWLHTQGWYQNNQHLVKEYVEGLLTMETKDEYGFSTD